MKTRRVRACLSLLLTLVMVISIFTGSVTPTFAAEDQVETTVETTAEPAEEAPAVTVEDTAPENKEPETKEETVEEDEEEPSEDPDESTPEKDTPSENPNEVAPAEKEAPSENPSEGSTPAAPTEEVEVAETIEDSTQDEPLKDGVSPDLADHIKTLEIIGDPDYVTSGTNLTVKFGWLIEGEVNGATDTFTYQLPVNFAIDVASTGPITRGENGRTIGTYRVDTNGLVTIRYFSDYNTSNQTTINYMEITGTAKYNPSDSDHDIEFVWKDGSKVVIVRNDGDFTVEKSRQPIWPNGKLASNLIMRYTVTISSEQGTNGDFTVTDALTLSEPYGTGTSFASVAYDQSTMKIVDEQGNEVTGWTVDVKSRSFTITGLPKLDAGESYILTYDIDVERAIRTNTYYATRDGSIRNTVTATSDGDSVTASASGSFSSILTKSAIGLDVTKGRWWQIRIYANGTDLTGYRVKDISQHPISDTVALRAYDSSGNWLETIEYKTEFIGETEFEITLPHGEVNGKKINEWRVSYYTNGEVEAGQTAPTTNTAYLYGNDEEWEVQQSSTIGIGNQTISTPKKGYIGNETNPDNPEYLDFAWNLEVTYNSLNAKSVTFSDVILAPSRRSTDQWGNQSSTDGVNPDGHFSFANRLDAELKDSTNGLHIVLSDDSELTYDQAIAAGYTINITYYDGTVVAQSGVVASTDSTTHVRRFAVTVTAPEGQEKLDAKRIYVSRYQTTFDTSMMTPNYVWRINNRISADGNNAESYGEVSKQMGSISKQVRVVRAKDENGVVTSATYLDGSANVDYDLQDGKLRYRLLVTVPEGQTSATITDLIPAGLTLAPNAGSGIAWDNNLMVGLYTTNGGILKSATNADGNSTWTDANRAANISVSQQAEGDATRLTVTIDNLDSVLKFRGSSRIIAIDYIVSMPKDLGETGTTTEEDGGFVATQSFHNEATFEGATASHDTTAKQTQKVLSKAGEQIIEDGAYTKRVHYSVKVNPNAQDLLEGSDELTLTDTMTSTALDFKLDATSIKLYKDGVEVEPLEVNVEQPTTEDGTTTQIFTISVYDATTYTLEYDFIADRLESASAATFGDFVNEIALKGHVSDTDTTTVRGINVRATSNHAGLTLVKVDEKNNAKFLTAEFKLEKFDGTDYELVENFTISGQNGFNFDYYSENCKLEGNTLYRIVETSAPEGYNLDETPFYFIIKGNIQDVRSGSISMTELVITTDAQARAEANVPNGIEVNMLEPDTGSYFEIKNERAPASGKAVLEATKTLTGRDLKAGEFSFTVKEGDDVVATGTNDADGKITFTEIKYQEADLGEHTYTITENDGKLGGITYDDSSYEVKVTVTDVETTTYDVEIEYPDNGVVFANKYEADGAVKLEASKTLTGRELQAGEFSFSVKEGDTIVATGTNDADGNIEFSQINYDQDDVGTHTYTITEDPGQLSGVTYDTNSYTVTVEVTDSGSGKLVAVPAYPSEGVEFENSYDVDATSVTLEATKNLTGRDLEAGEFTFTVTEGTETVATGTNGADGKISFSTINYELSDVGTHTYTITEDAGQLGGITYDDSSLTVTVEVTDNGDGTLSTEITYPDGGAVFENSYEASGDVTLEATKNLTGRDLKAGEFSFSVKEDDKVVATGTNDADGKIEFSQIDYDQNQTGTHTYTVTEDPGQLEGVTYSTASFEVTVEVTDNRDGTLAVSITYPLDGVEFENDYNADAVSVTLEATKNLTGRDLEAGEFTFTVTEGTETVATGTNDADGKVTFSTINYELSDVGTHTLTVTENAGQLGGVTYDNSSFTVTVEVTDNGDGTLSTGVSYPEGGIVFENSYEASGEIALEAAKTLTGRDLKDNEFFFTVAEDGETVATGTNDAEGGVSFSDIQYTLDDIGTHTYTITEDAGTLSGVTYDDNSYTVTVEVTDNGDGTLKAEATYPEGGVRFENTYDVDEASITLEATKNLTGRDLNDGEFTFTVTEDGNTVATGENDVNGNIEFTPISYGLSDVGTHTYVITEDAGQLGGVTYSTASFEVTVTVTDNGDGTLNVQKTMDVEEIVFENSYAAEGSVELEATKTLTGRELKEGEFSFTITEDDETVSTGTNDADGNIAFDAINYTLDDLGTHTYIITEDAGQLGGVTYSDASFEVIVTVTDNGDGTLSAIAEYPENGVVFENTYDVTPVELTLEATKELTGRDLKEGEFTFTVAEDGETVATGANDVDGKVVFSVIEYKLADVGTHTYVITEDAGDKGGVDYSKESYTVTVTVTDNGDGTLDVQKAEPENGIVFHNGYDAAEAVVSLGAKKTLSGATLKDGQFSFTLKDADGRVIETVSNKANGSIAFTDLHFTEAGVYSYTISEVVGNDSQVTYDTTVYNVKITVVDNEEGKLIATVDTEGKTLQFNNKYTPNEPKKPSTPSNKTKKSTGARTGDDSNSMIWISLLLAAAVAAAALVIKRMRDAAK